MFPRPLRMCRTAHFTQQTQQREEFCSFQRRFCLQMVTPEMIDSYSLTSKATFLLYVLAILMNVSASQTTSFRPDCRSLFSWVRDPGDCRHFWRCVWGIPYEMPPCPEGQVLNNAHYVCVLRGSSYDDCDNQQIAAPETRGQQYQTFSQTTRQPTPTAGWTVTSPPPAASQSPSWLATKCGGNSAAVFPHPEQCQAYYKCRQPTPGVPDPELRLEQCPDGTLFDDDTLDCGDLWTVDCGARARPSHLIDFHQVELLNASCADKQDGAHAVSHGFWSPIYVLCTRGAISTYSQCRFDEQLAVPQVFSPEVSKCLNLYQVPPENGGLRPNCTTQINGFYPDDHGRPDLYYVCQDQKVYEIARCSDGSVFDAKFSFCRLPYL